MVALLRRRQGFVEPIEWIGRGWRVGDLPRLDLGRNKGFHRVTHEAGSVGGEAPQKVPDAPLGGAGLSDELRADMDMGAIENPSRGVDRADEGDKPRGLIVVYDDLCRPAEGFLEMWDVDEPPGRQPAAVAFGQLSPRRGRSLEQVVELALGDLIDRLVWFEDMPACGHLKQTEEADKSVAHESHAAAPRSGADKDDPAGEVGGFSAQLAIDGGRHTAAVGSQAGQRGHFHLPVLLETQLRDQETLLLMETGCGPSCGLARVLKARQRLDVLFQQTARRQAPGTGRSR